MFGFQPTAFPAPLPPPPFHQVQRLERPGHRPPPCRRRCQSWVVPFSIFDANRAAGLVARCLKGYLTTVPLAPHSGYCHRTCPRTQDTQATPPPASCPTAATLVDLVAFPTSPPRPAQLGCCHLDTLTTTSTADTHAAPPPPQQPPLPLPTTTHASNAATTTTRTRRCPLNRHHHHRRPPSTPATPPPTRLSHLPTPSACAVINATVTAARLHAPRPHQHHRRRCRPTTRATPASTPSPSPPPDYTRHARINTTALALTSHQPRPAQPP
ncbi:hypothetical protein EDB89DRAFT_2010341 [Lactarius sanguifluus]|nr:hypothetical protein EDB89DRAFT_2010341 [Lactarius sanguifluus]